MLSVVTPQTQDIHYEHHHNHNQNQQQHAHYTAQQPQQQHSQKPQPLPPAYLLQNQAHHSLPMPHRVQESHLVRSSSETSTATMSSTASTPPASSISSVSSSTSSISPSSADASVVQALEIARDSPDGGHDPTVSKILESALNNVWSKVQAHPDSYVMSRDEFSLFNYFQHRFADDATARLARKRYWNNMRA